MAKKIIKISRGGESAAAPQAGPAKPISLSQAMNPEQAPQQAQPQKRIVVNGRTAPSRPAATAGAARSRTGQANQQRRKPQKKSGPPLWLIPVGIVGLVLLIVIISYSGKKPDPYYAGGPVVEQPKQQRVLNQHTGPRPMRDYMEKHGPTEMAKQRAARMGRKPAGSK